MVSVTEATVSVLHLSKKKEEAVETIDLKIGFMTSFNIPSPCSVIVVLQVCRPDNLGIRAEESGFIFILYNKIHL